VKIILDYLIHHAEMVPVSPLPERVCEDPDDDKFLACAIACGEKLVVSGDKHLLTVSGYEGVIVMKPREFVDQYLRL